LFFLTLVGSGSFCFNIVDDNWNQRMNDAGAA
jgi:hypothetical protein